jgi:ketosteroid isomerase-like protein
MSKQNVDLVRAFIDAMARGDRLATRAALDPAIEWTPIESDPGYAVHRGLEDVEAWLIEWAEVFPDLRWEVERIVDAGADVVVALVRAAGRGATSGVDLETPVYGTVFTIRSGKIVRIEEHESSRRALKAARLRE